MTKYFDWARVKDMDSRKKSDINMSSTFTEQRKKKETHRYSKEFGIRRLEEEVNVNWGKAEGVYEAPMRKLAKIAAAEHKGEEAKDQEIAQENLKDESEE